MTPFVIESASIAHLMHGVVDESVGLMPLRCPFVDSCHSRLSKMVPRRAPMSCTSPGEVSWDWPDHPKSLVFAQWVHLQVSSEMQRVGGPWQA